MDQEDDGDQEGGDQEGGVDQEVGECVTSTWATPDHWAPRPQWIPLHSVSAPPAKNKAD